MSDPGETPVKDVKAFMDVYADGKRALSLILYSTNCLEVVAYGSGRVLTMTETEQLMRMLARHLL